MRSGTLVVPEPEAPRVQRLDDLVDRLLAEVGDRVELALGLRHEVADRLDAGTLEAVVGPDSELELLDQDVVHGVRRARRRADLTATDEPRLQRAPRARLAQLDDAIGVGEDRELGDEDL